MSKKTSLKLNAKAVITLFGGKHRIVHDFNKFLKKKLSIKTVEKWDERENIPTDKLVDLKEIANKTKISFVVDEFIIAT